MIRWLKRAFREWLLDDELSIDVPEDNTLLCWVKSPNGRSNQEKYEIVGAVGLRLHGQRLGGTDEGERLLSPNEACDRRQFWRTWRRLSGHPRLTWGNGTPADP